MKLSNVTKKIKPFLVMEILDKAKRLEESKDGVIHLEIGEPDFKTPKIVCDSAINAIKEGRTGYTHSQGLAGLREDIAAYYLSTYKVNISPSQIIVGLGTSPLLLISLATIIDPGDEVIITSPTYACYPNFIRLLSGKCKFVNLDANDGFKFNVKKIKAAISKKTKALIINSPSNPTGLIIDEGDLKPLANLGIEIISDEIYHGLTYENKAHSLLEYNNNSTVINGFSKLFAMPGFRIGFAISTERRIRCMQKMQQNFFISASNFGQRAAQTALKHRSNYLPKMIEAYNKRRKYLLKELPKIGFEIKAEPKGAFYVFADVRKFTNSSYDFAMKLLEETRVAITPGIDFGDNCEGFVRISYANSLDNIKEAIKRLKNYLQ